MCAERHHSDALLHTPCDLVIAALATRQDGVVSTAQLKSAGVGRGAIQLRVRRGRLHPRYEADFLWRDQRLIVETDGAATHFTAQAFEDDRRRDAELMTLGYRVVRFTRRQVVCEPRATLATVDVLLARGG